MTDPYRSTDPIAPDLTKRKTVNWPERMIAMEIHQLEIQASLKEIKEESRYAMVSLAESNERLANHYEDNKRMNQRMDEQSAQNVAMREDLIRLEKSMIELRMQNQILIDFSTGVKRATWIVITGGGVVVWWFIQRYLEHPK